MAESLQATTMFLYIEGVNGGVVPGESQDSVHCNEVQVMSIEVHSSAEKSGGEGSWRADFSPISLTIVTSKASPSLARAVWSGTVYKRFIVSCRKQGAGKTSADYMQWRFSDVQVVDHNFKIQDERPEETIKISYQQIEMYYARQDRDGTLKDSVKRSWSLDENKDATITLPFVPKAASSASSS
jgi:type VI secretion system Hcp family effector